MLKDIEGRHNNQQSTKSLEHCSKKYLLELYPATVNMSVTTIQGNTTELLLIVVHTSLNKLHMNSYVSVLEKGK